MCFQVLEIRLLRALFCVELFKKAAVFEAQFFIEYTFEVAELKSQRWNLPEYSCNRLIQAT